jgi:hypothetical protein
MQLIADLSLAHAQCLPERFISHVKTEAPVHMLYSIYQCVLNEYIHQCQIKKNHIYECTKHKNCLFGGFIDMQLSFSYSGLLEGVPLCYLKHDMEGTGDRKRSCLLNIFLKSSTKI